MFFKYSSMDEETFSSNKLMEGQNSCFAFVKKLTFTREEGVSIGFLCHPLGGEKIGSNLPFSVPCRGRVKKKRRRVYLNKLVGAAARVMRARALMDSRS